MSTTTVSMEAEVTITIEDGTDWLWYREEGREPLWRGDDYRLKTEDAIREHWAYNAVVNGVEDASRLDGWADIERGKITFSVLAGAI